MHVQLVSDRFRSARTVSVSIMASVILSGLFFKSGSLASSINITSDNAFDLTTRYLRDISIVVLYLWVLLFQRAIHISCRHTMLALAICVVYCVLRSVAGAIELDSGLPLLGIRLLQFAPLAIISRDLLENEPAVFLRYMWVALQIFLFVQFIVAIMQLLVAVPSKFGSTIFGMRIYGTLGDPLVFGMSIGCLSCLWMLFRELFPSGQLKFGIWPIFACLFLAIASGNRTGMLICIVSWWPIIRQISGIRLGVVVILAAPVIFFFAIDAVSVASFSGRESASSSDIFIRTELWLRSTANMSSVSMLFGEGFARSTNAAVILSSDNIGSNITQIIDGLWPCIYQTYGLIGVVLFLMIPLSFWQFKARTSWALCALTLPSITFVVLEVFPACVFIFMGLALLGNEGDTKLLDAAVNVSNEPS